MHPRREATVPSTAARRHSLARSLTLICPEVGSRELVESYAYIRPTVARSHIGSFMKASVSAWFHRCAPEKA